jgi:hypothetical protein
MKKLPKNVDDNSKTFVNKLINITDNFQIHQQVSTFDSKRKTILNESEDESTKIFLNKSMDITETINTGNSNLTLIQEMYLL